MGGANAVVKLSSSCAPEPRRSNNNNGDRFIQDRRCYRGCSMSRYVEVCLFNIAQHRSSILLRSAPLLKPRQNQFVGMALATHQCRLEMTVDSGGDVGL